MLNQHLNDFEKIIQRLHDALREEKTDMNRDSAIKRFELCYDLAWKSIQHYAREQGLDCASPRGCFKTAFELKLIDGEETWFQMIEDRNRSTHLYHEGYADQVYDHLPDYLKLFENLLEHLKVN